MARKATRTASDPRRAVVEALMALAARQPFDQITLTEIANEAGISLADLRDLFPSKGAILGGLMRMIDREVLEGASADMADQPAQDRVLDVMMRRFDALAPYKDGLRSMKSALRRDPVSALAFNQAAVNSWRYMLESAGIDIEGPMGALRCQGAVLVFARAFDTWLEDGEDMARTMAVLDRELTRGGQVLRQAEALDRLTAPFRGFARALCRRRSERRRSPDNSDEAAQAT